jgi:hypothetical protein
MIITEVEDKVDIKYAYLNLFPDQFKTEKEKGKKSFIKETMDYFGNVAYAQYNKNRQTFVHNYDLVKGIINYHDFYNTQPQEVRTFVDSLLGDKELPEYVRHYPILNPPLNTLVGELSKRPDVHRVRAFDDNSLSEEFEFKTNLTQQLIIQQGKQKIIAKLAAQGEDVEGIADEELNTLTIESVKDQLADYTSTGERWGNETITALKAEFRMKDKSEDCFRDLAITSREFFHIYPDNSRTGFNTTGENPKNVWYLTTPDRKYTSDPYGRQEGAYAAGTVHVYEISEIIEKFPKLTIEEIDHLRESAQDYGLINVRESNLFTNQTGNDSIKYDTYSRAILQDRMIAESEMKENRDDLRSWFGSTGTTGAFGYKYTVVRAYWQSKKKVGRVDYIDENGDEQTTFVDESYKPSPNQIGDVEWGWVNQWYHGYRIGPDVYHIEPFELFDYCPIIGVIHEVKNTEAKSLVDLMKPYQMIYNVAMNQLWNLLEKEIGVVYNIKLRKIPIPKDGDGQDALEMWEEEARKRGIVFEDDSPENMKAPMSNTDNSRAVDLGREKEFATRWELAQRMKLECWELVGMNRQRLGQSQASSTAQAQQNDLAQSFAQTEPYFNQHEYLLDQVYQAMLDAAQYLESKNPNSTIASISSEGVSSFIRVTPPDIKMRDLRIFSVSRPEDQKLFNEIRQLSQAMLQNGADPYDVLELYSTNSMRQMKKKFKDLKDERQQLIAQQQQMEQQQLAQQQQIASDQLEEQARQKELDRINENFNKEQDRISRERVAIISALGFGKVEAEDSNNNQVYDVLETTRLSLEQQESHRELEFRLRELDNKQRELDTKRSIELEKIKVERENMKNDMAIARIQAKAKAKAASKKPKAKK